MSFLTKIFCNHKWIVYSHKEGTKEIYFLNISGEYKPSGLKQDVVQEIIICQKCGNIKKIEL